MMLNGDRARDYGREQIIGCPSVTPHTVGAAAGSLKAVQNQIHTRDLWDLGIPNLGSAGTSMATTNFTLINLVKACCDLVEVTSQSDSEKKTAFLLLSTLFCHQIWGTFYIRPTSKAVSNAGNKRQKSGGKILDFFC